MKAAVVGLAAALALSGVSSQDPGPVALGDVPVYAFRTPLIRGTGEKSLADFRGQPVLVQFWNSTLWGAVDDMMKVMLRLQLEHEGLQVILVETRLAPAALERLLLRKGWLATSAMWTTERPFAHGESDPCCVLLSCDGAVILKSPPLGKLYDRTYSNEFLEELDAAVEAEVERRYGLLSEEAPPPVRKACDDFAAGRIARALASLRALGADEPAAAHAREAFERELARRLGRAEYLLGLGRLGEVEALLAPLAGAELGAAASPRAAALRAELDSDARKPEREADRALAKLERTLFEEGADKRTPSALRALAQRHGGTRRGAEAARLAALLAEE